MVFADFVCSLALFAFWALPCGPSTRLFSSLWGAAGALRSYALAVSSAWAVVLLLVDLLVSTFFLWFSGDLHGFLWPAGCWC